MDKSRPSKKAIFVLIM